MAHCEQCYLDLNTRIPTAFYEWANVSSEPDSVMDKRKGGNEWEKNDSFYIVTYGSLIY